MMVLNPKQRTNEREKERERKMYPNVLFKIIIYMTVTPKISCNEAMVSDFMAFED